MTPPPPHPAGIVLTRPGYYTVPSLEVLAELVDDGGDCNVEDLTIGREGYGSIFFPGITNVANLNIDETGKNFRQPNNLPFIMCQNRDASGSIDFCWELGKLVRAYRCGG